MDTAKMREKMIEAQERFGAGRTDPTRPIRRPNVRKAAAGRYPFQRAVIAGVDQIAARYRHGTEGLLTTAEREAIREAESDMATASARGDYPAAAAALDRWLKAWGNALEAAARRRAN